MPGQEGMDVCGTPQRSNVAGTGDSEGTAVATVRIGE